MPLRSHHRSYDLVQQQSVRQSLGRAFPKGNYLGLEGCEVARSEVHEGSNHTGERKSIYSQCAPRAPNIKWHNVGFAPQVVAFFKEWVALHVVFCVLSFINSTYSSLFPSARPFFFLFLGTEGKGYNIYFYCGEESWKS